MLVNQGHYDDLADCCKQCINIRVMSPNMDGNNYYCCGKYPLTDKEKVCPRFEQIEDN